MKRLALSSAAVILAAVVFLGAPSVAFAAKGIVKGTTDGSKGRILVTASDADSAVQPGSGIEFTEDVASRGISDGDYVNFDIQTQDVASLDIKFTAATTAFIAVNIFKISTGTVITASQNGNLVIAANQAVTIKNGARVNGNINVQGGNLFVTGQSSIGGNLRITAGGSFILCEGQSTVSGTNFKVTGGDSNTFLQISTCRVNGRFNSSGVSTVKLLGNTHNGNVISRGDGNVTITGNTINGRLKIVGTTGTCISSDNTFSGASSTLGCLAHPQEFIPVTFHLADGDLSPQIIPQSIHVHFNPNQFPFEEATPWEHESTLDGDSPVMEFTSGEPTKLQFDLFFDGYEEKKSVRESVDKIEALALVNQKLHRPPTCLLVWGTLDFKCVLEMFQTRFTLFLDDGTPVRAVMSVVFKEFSPSEAQIETIKAEAQRNAEAGAIETIKAEAQRNAEASAGEDPAGSPRIFVLLPTSTPAFMPIAIGGTNFGQGAIPFINSTPSIALFGFSTQNLPLIGSISVGVTIIPPSAPPGSCSVQVEWFGQRSKPFLFSCSSKIFSSDRLSLDGGSAQVSFLGLTD